MVNSIDFQYFPQMGKLLIDFYIEATEHDIKDRILSYFKTGSTDEQTGKFNPLHIFVSQWLKDYSTNPVEPQNIGTIFIPIFTLHSALRKQGKLLEDYLSQINDLNVT